MLQREVHWRIIIRGVPGWLVGCGGLWVSGTKRNKTRGKEHGRKVLEQEGKQACTQHDQVFIAKFYGSS